MGKHITKHLCARYSDKKNYKSMAHLETIYICLAIYIRLKLNQRVLELDL